MTVHSVDEWGAVAQERRHGIADASGDGAQEGAGPGGQELELVRWMIAP